MLLLFGEGPAACNPSSVDSPPLYTNPTSLLDLVHGPNPVICQHLRPNRK